MKHFHGFDNREGKYDPLIETTAVFDSYVFRGKIRSFGFYSITCNMMNNSSKMSDFSIPGFLTSAIKTMQILTKCIIICLRYVFMKFRLPISLYNFSSSFFFPRERFFRSHALRVIQSNA